jgi:hypothetical protein
MSPGKLALEEACRLAALDDVFCLLATTPREERDAMWAKWCQYSPNREFKTLWDKFPESKVRFLIVAGECLLMQIECNASREGRSISFVSSHILLWHNILYCWHIHCPG